MTIMLLDTRTAREISAMMYPDFRNFFAKGEICGASFAVVRAL